MAAIAESLLLFVPVASDAAAVSIAVASVRRPRLARSKRLEETMRVHALTELMRLSRTELFDLAGRITTMLPHYSDHAPERFNANINLRNIRRELLRREWSP